MQHTAVSTADWDAKYDKEGVKFDADKLRYDLLPVHAIEEIVKVFTVGAKKYADRNWQKGIKYSRLLAAMDRHKAAYAKGEQYDEETGCCHLACVAWYCLVMMEFDRFLPEMDDRDEMLQYGNQPAVEIINEALDRCRAAGLPGTRDDIAYVGKSRASAKML